MANTYGERVVTPEFRLNYPHVFKIGKGFRGKEGQFEITMLFPLGADLTKLKAAAMAVGVERWGPDVAKWPIPRNNPFKDQGDTDTEGYIKGATYMKAKSKDKPVVVDKVPQSIIDPAEIYAGCYGLASLTPSAYGGLKGEEMIDAGINFYLAGFQKTRDGDPLSGRGNVQNDFEPIQGGNDAGPAAASADSIFG